jgi:Family of unknown function (DUF6328)
VARHQRKPQPGQCDRYRGADACDPAGHRVEHHREGHHRELPFQQRFDRLDGPMRIVYLVTVGCAIASTLCLVAPVAMHRMLFRQRRVKSLVSASHRLTVLGLTLLGAALVGVVPGYQPAVTDQRGSPLRASSRWPSR